MLERRDQDASAVVVNAEAWRVWVGCVNRPRRSLHGVTWGYGGDGQIWHHDSGWTKISPVDDMQRITLPPASELNVENCMLVGEKWWLR